MSVDYALVDRTQLSSSIFFPMRDDSVAGPGAQDLRIEVAPGVAVGARHYRASASASASAGTVLYFHGNGEIVSDHDGLAPYYHDIGLDLFVVDYRGYGRSDGDPSFATMVADALPIARRFHELLDADDPRGLRLVMGRSLGGYPAMEIAARCPIRFDGLVLSSSAGEGQRLASRLSNAPSHEVDALIAGHTARLGRINLPTLMIHGEEDQVIPLTDAEGLRDKLSSVSDLRFVALPRVGHNDVTLLAFDEYFGAIGQFVERQSKHR